MESGGVFRDLPQPVTIHLRSRPIFRTLPLKRGRGRVPRERQETLLDEFERSGVSGIKFAVFCRVNYPSFAGWVPRRREREGAGAPAEKPAPLQWMEVLLSAAASGAALVLHRPGGVRMEKPTARPLLRNHSVWPIFSRLVSR